MTALSDDLPSLYDITGKITDHNTLLINRNVLRKLEADAELLDWLDNNLFNRENLDMFGKLVKDYNMWVMFSPKGAYGSARTILEAAMKGQQ